MAVIVLPWIDSRLSPNARTHWAVKAKASKACRQIAFWQTKEAKAKVDWGGVIHVWIDFYPPDRRSRDDDNLISAFKPYRDGIADALGLDDKRFRIHPEIKEETRRPGCIEVRLTRELING